ncbi:MAG: type II toxin-antitoxin system RelE/ParE family toxin [Parasphingopyxis sp.]|nr:type II toxin-antitoxin system RelE/ParE family toxin [Sphingomonadales bacterium]
MKRLRYSRKAVGDLDEIWDYTKRSWGREQANLYTSNIDAACRALASGEARSMRVELGANTFERVRCASHAIFAVEEAEVMLVVRILHLRQDIEAHLGDSG